MAENVVFIEIIGRDMMSPLIDSILNKMTGVGDMAGNFWGALGAEVFVRGIDLAIARVNALTDALGEAASIETQQIASASDIATNLGISMEQSRSIVNDTAKEIARVAAALPGETQGYNEIFNAISGAVSDQIKYPEEFQRTSLELTKRIGALAAIRGQPTSDAGSQAMRLLAGTVGYGEARASFDFLQKNPMLQKAIERQAAALGTSVDQWKTMAADMRLEIFQKALSEAAPDQLFEAFSGTAEDYIQGLKTRFFDPSIGIFGMMREVSSRGNRTVLDAAKGSLGAFSALLDSLGELEWALDPLAGLIDFFDGVTRFLSGAQQWISSGSLPSGGIDLGAISGQAVLAASDAFWSFIQSAVNRVGEVFQSINWSGIGDILAELAIAFGIVLGRVPGELATIIDSIDWVAVGTAFGYTMMWLLTRAAEFIWEFAPRFVVGVVNLFVELVWAFGELVLGAITGTIGYIVTKTLEPIGEFFQPIADRFAGVRSFVENAINTVRSFFDGALSSVARLVERLRQFAVNTIGRIPGFGRVFDSAGPSTAPPDTSKAFELPNTTTPAINALPLATPATPGTNNSSTFAPQVNVPVQAGGDPAAIGEAVVSRLNAMYRQYTEGTLA